jgi:hypothetical protein
MEPHCPGGVVRASAADINELNDVLRGMYTYVVAGELLRDAHKLLRAADDVDTL